VQAHVRRQRDLRSRVRIRKRLHEGLQTEV
jgi:hypothetical protein